MTLDPATQAGPATQPGPAADTPATASDSHPPKPIPQYPPQSAAHPHPPAAPTGRLGRVERRLIRLWDRLSLTTRLTAVLTIILMGGLTLSGIAALGILQNHMQSQVDAELRSSARKLAETSVRSLLADSSPSLPTNYFVKVDLQDGRDTYFISDSTRERAGIPIDVELLPIGMVPPEGVTNPVTVDSITGSASWRMVAVPLVRTDTSEPAGVVNVGLPLDSIQRTLYNTALYLLLSSLMLIVGGAWMARLLVKRALRPLNEIENVAGRIASGDLTQRIDYELPSTEVGSLARSLNVMLSHIESAFEVRQNSEAKMRRFVHDASHELRTPLTAISGYSELYRMGGVKAEDVGETLDRIESEARRMASLVESLLTLARLDEGRPLRLREVDLVKLARHIAWDYRALDPERQVTVTGLHAEDPPTEIIATVDRDQITQVLANLGGNIMRYTPEGSPVEIALGTETGLPFILGEHGPQPDPAGATITFAIIEVRDHGEGVPDAEKAKVFERFYRTDSSRSRRSGGSGLGLSIVASIAQAHQGRAILRDTPGGGLTVRLELPLGSRATGTEVQLPAGD